MVGFVNIKTLEEAIGNTPLVRLQRQEISSNTLVIKLEGNNPAGSVKDRPAQAMIAEAEKSGRIKTGDSLIEATSGNTGIALAMVAAIKGYRMILIMPENASVERRTLMTAYGARCILTPKERGMEGAIDKAQALEREGKGIILNQYDNQNNPLSHYLGTGPEIWRDTEGKITHFVASMGTTGTIMGTGRFLKEKNADIQIVGVQPAKDTHIPGIRKWSQEYLPKIYEPQRIDRIVTVSQTEAETTARRICREEGLFCGISSGGNIAAALKVLKNEEKAFIVTIMCDRGDRYLSTGVFA